MLWSYWTKLPPVESLKDVQLQTPLRIYSSDGKLIAEYGEKRRDPVSSIDDVPSLMKEAVIAAEDERFYEHPGVDWFAITRAAVDLLQTGQKRQGGSTITMQVARNFFLTREKTYTRKLKEIMLAVKIERELSKDEILTLYLNKIFLGHRAYGVVAAAKVYYGSSLSQLTLPQIAMIAGLPKAPSRTNPISYPSTARARRSYVLNRMLERGVIGDEQFNEAVKAVIVAKRHGQQIETSAPHLGEMVRIEVEALFGDSANTSGLKVYTTISSHLQKTATRAIRKSLADYDRRHGYRGPEGSIGLAMEVNAEEYEAALSDYPNIGGFHSAIVISLEEQSINVYAKGQGIITVPWGGLSWARKYLSQDKLGDRPRNAEDIIEVGDIVRVVWRAPDVPVTIDESAATAPASGFWQLGQIPLIEGALISLSPSDGSVQALVGGLDYHRSKFNRVIQARRQPGSNFKPFIYSAALEKGFTAASIVNDAPIVFEDQEQGDWIPKNFGGKFLGPTRLREALTKSRNLVAIRLLRAIKPSYAVNYVARFGFDKLPSDLSLALGSAELTPMELVTGYATFANGGYKVNPYFIQRIESRTGETLFEEEPAIVCEICEDVSLDEDDEPTDLMALLEMEEFLPNKAAPRVVAAENAWIIDSMLKDVIKRGTGRRARVLGRGDLAGKTGTTNDQKDAWFSGYNGRVAATVWVGFDREAPMGRRETGARAALPAWIDYMRVALQGTNETELPRPPGLVTVRIDSDTGLLASADHPDAIFESFPEGSVPARADNSLEDLGSDAVREDTGREHLF